MLSYVDMEFEKSSFSIFAIIFILQKVSLVLKRFFILTFGIQLERIMLHEI